jgi:rhomboid protease GluP
MQALDGRYGVDSAGPNATGTIIPAFSKRQVMDWSLVLASQDIPTTIVQSNEAGWGLLIEPQDQERALQAIRQYRLENRRWRWRQPIPWSEATFHWGALGWCLALLVIHWVVSEEAPDFRALGQLDTAQVWAGQWWRAFTAILLHADLAHLLANVTTGLVLLGLAMARFGAGAALLAAYLAGAAGNGAGLMLHARPYYGLGASGMVMGALGLISASPYLRGTGLSLKRFLQAVVSGVFIFLILGVNPASDVIAHLGGFLSGLILGWLLALLPPRILQHRAFVSAAWLVLLGLLAWTGWLALLADSVAARAA